MSTLFKFGDGIHITFRGCRNSILVWTLIPLYSGVECKIFLCGVHACTLHPVVNSLCCSVRCDAIMYYILVTPPTYESKACMVQIL